MSDIKQEVEKISSANSESFNRQDAAGIAALYADGGMHINPAGPRTDIEQFYQGVFKAGFDHQEVSVDDAWPLGADAALAIGQYRISGRNPSGTLPQRGGYWTATYVREGGKWKIRMQTAIPKQMCNLYSITTNQAAIIALFRVINRYVGNLPPMPGVFPDYPAPVIRNTDAGTEMVTMRRGMPDGPPQEYTKH